jgi:hypothetical protein
MPQRLKKGAKIHNTMIHNTQYHPPEKGWNKYQEVGLG